MNRTLTRSPAVRTLGICVVLGAALALSGCDDNSSIGSQSVSDAKATASAARAEAEAAAADDNDSSSGTDTSSSKVSTDNFCSLLSTETTKVAGLNTVETRQVVRKDISNLFDPSGTVTESDAAQMDKMTKSCTYDAARVMAQSRILSFKQLFYGL